jgi:hypothetical protein
LRPNNELLERGGIEPLPYGIAGTGGTTGVRGSGYALHRPYLIASRRATILQIHKYLAMRLGTTTNHRFCILVHAPIKTNNDNGSVEYGDVPLANNETLDSIERKYWRHTNGIRLRHDPLVLTYTIAMSAHIKPALLPVPLTSNGVSTANSPTSSSSSPSSITAPVSSRVITIPTNGRDSIANGPSSPTSVAIDVFTFFSSENAVFDTATAAAASSLLTPEAALAQFIPAAPVSAIAAPIATPWAQQSTVLATSSSVQPSLSSMSSSSAPMSSLSRLASLPSSSTM